MIQLAFAFFLALQSDLKAAKIELKKVGLSPANATLFALCEKNYTRIKEEKKQAKESVFVRVGKAVIYGLHSMRRFIEFTGVVFWAMFKSVKHPSTIRFVAFLNEVGGNFLNPANSNHIHSNAKMHIKAHSHDRLKIRAGRGLARMGFWDYAINALLARR